MLVVFFGSAFAGLTLGLLGGGIGLVLIPLLVYLLTIMNVPNAAIMRFAIGTSVAATVIIGMLGSYQHHQTGRVNWPIVKQMSLGIVIGSALGASVVKYLPSNLLMFIFALVTLLLAVQLWFVVDNKTINLIHPVKKKTGYLIGGSLVIGFIGSSLGVNPFCVPLLKKLHGDLLEAIATTVVIGTMMAIVVMALFITLGLSEKNLPAYTTGYVVWSLCLPISIISCMFVPAGVKLAGFLSKKTLNRLYVSLLVVIAVKMIYASGYPLV